MKLGNSLPSSSLKEITGELNKPDIGMLFVVPVLHVEGINTPLIEG